MIKTYSFEDGKYEYDRDTDSGQIVAARRHGEPWVAGLDVVRFAKSFGAVLDHIDNLEDGTMSIPPAAAKLAEVMGYPWAHMPEEGRRRMHTDARAILNAGLKGKQP